MVSIRPATIPLIVVRTPNLQSPCLDRKLVSKDAKGQGEEDRYPAYRAIESIYPFRRL